MTSSDNPARRNWTIPVAGVIGALTVSFSSSAAAAPPVQRPVSGAEQPSVPEPPSTAQPTPPVLPDPGPTSTDDTAQAGVAPAVAAPLPEPSPTPPASEVGATVDPLAPIAPDEHESASSSPPRASQRALRPTDKRGFFSMSVGGSTSGAYYGLGGMDFGWQALIGTHSAKRPTFGGGLMIAQRKGYFNELTVAGRLLWDRPLSDAFAIYSSMNVDFGVNMTIGYGSYLTPPQSASALLGIGWGVETILFERLKLGVRPISVNLVVPDFASQIFMRLRWDVMATIGVVW